VSGTKAELAKRIKAKDTHIIIFDEVLATFRVMAERDGLEILKPDVMREVRQAAASITLNPHLARAFQGGIPEVSAFWVDEYGIPCKARLDWLKPRTIVDLKKCANARKRPFDVAVILAIAQYRYDLSARHYLDGYRYLYQFAAEDRVLTARSSPAGTSASCRPTRCASPSSSIRRKAHPSRKVWNCCPVPRRSTARRARQIEAGAEAELEDAAASGACDALSVNAQLRLTH
jgi:hypothetical protein